jgi:hypothetical protein
MTAGRSLSGTPALAGRAALRSPADTATGVMAMGAAALAVAVAAAGATLLMRRLSGGFAAVPSAAVPWAVAIAGIPLVIAVEAAARLAGERWPAGLARAGLVAAAMAVAPLTATAAWPTRAIGLIGTTVALIAALRPVAGWRPPRLPGFRRAGRPGGDQSATPATDGGGLGGEERNRSFPSGPMRSSAFAEPSSGGGDWPAVLPAGFRQRLERYDTPAGEDCVRGQVMISVPSGSRTGHAHVGFCPAFATLPAVEVTTDCDFVEAEVAAAEILPWGVRVECRLSEPAEEPLEIPVAIRAVRPA